MLCWVLIIFQFPVVIKIASDVNFSAESSGENPTEQDSNLMDHWDLHVLDLGMQISPVIYKYSLF